MIETGADKLMRLAASGDGEDVVDTISIRTLLSWFEQKRRGYLVAQTIREALDAAGLETEPDFEDVNIDASVRLKRKPKVIAGQGAATIAAPIVEARGEVGTPRLSATPPGAVVPALAGDEVHAEHPDPSFRLSRLKAAHNRPVSVAPDADLERAVTMMLSHDFSQLPVIAGRTVKGVISWSSIAPRLATGHSGASVRDFMEPAVPILDSTSSFFDAVRVIIENGYVLVRGHDQQLSGIVTSSDLCLQFEALTEPFLLLSEIENGLRRIIAQAKFSAAELGSAKDPSDTNRTISSPNDMTFGEYLRLLENPENWKKVSTTLDRVTFTDSLKRVKDIRNDVMHFDSDTIPVEDLEVLRTFARFLRRLKEIGAT